jgi:excisionase family DNA binding protein
MRTTITVPEISERLGICEETVYDMLAGHEIPNIRHGHRFIISRAAYERWEATIGEAVSPSAAKESKSIEAIGNTASRKAHSSKAA